MGARSAAPSRWRTWVILWGLCFAALVVLLPRRPFRRIWNPGPFIAMRFVDPHLLFFKTTGYSVLDVRDGSIRPLPEPVDDAPLATSGDATERRKASSFHEELWSVGRRGPRFGLRGIAGEFFLVSLPRGDEMRLSVRNWRTGQEVFRRDYPNGDISVTGNRAYVEWVAPGTGQARLDAWNVATGEPLPTPAPPEQLDLGRGQVSPDGQYLADPTGSSKLCLWSLTECRKLFTVQADLFAFSSDARRLAVLLHARPRIRRMGALRVYDLATGNIVAERKDATIALTAEGILAFQDEDRCVAAYSYKNIGVALREFQTIDVWRWKEDSLQTLQAQVGFQGPAFVTGGPPIAPRFVLDGQRVIDVVTGRPVCTLAPPKAEFLTPAPGWLVVRSRGPWLVNRLAAAVRPYSTSLAARIAPGNASELCDLTTGRSVAGLGTDSPRTIFSPDGKWLVTSDQTSIEIWRVPPSRPWGKAFAASLVIPLLAGFREWRSRRRVNRATDTA